MVWQGVRPEGLPLPVLQGLWCFVKFKLVVMCTSKMHEGKYQNSTLAGCLKTINDKLQQIHCVLGLPNLLRNKAA